MKILILLAIGLVWPSASFAGGYSASYDVYAGGIHALRAVIYDTESLKTYDIAVSSETYGLLDKIVPWHAKLSTSGKITKKGRIPGEHVSDTTTRSKHEVNTYVYDKTGQFKNFRQVVDDKDVTRTDIDPAIPEDTIDVLTTVFTLADSLSKSGDCNQEKMLFDSERSYRLTFSNGPKKTIQPGKYSSFSGEATGCTFEITPVGGKWHKKPRGWLKIQEQAKKSGQPPVIYFANLSKTKTPRFVPVSVVIKTDLGTFIAHMTSFEEKPGA